MSLVALWVIVALAAGILEVVVPAFGFVFVTLAALLAAVLALLGIGQTTQVVVFAAATLLFLLVLRRFFVRRLGAAGVPVAHRRAHGKLAEVTEAIDPVRGSGRVIVEGHDWAARAAVPDRRRERAFASTAPTGSCSSSLRVQTRRLRLIPLPVVARPARTRPLRAHRARQVDQGRAAEAGQADRAARPLPQAGRRGAERDRAVPRLGAGHDRPARADHADRAAARHHARQRHDEGGRRHLLRDRGPRALDLRGAEPRLGHRAARALRPAQRDRRARSRPHADLARHDQHAAARRARLGHPAVGRQDHAGRAQEHRPAVRTSS